MAATLTAPFPCFGGKRRAAELIWSRLGNVPNYVEPFCGSCAVLLARPGGAGKVETVNDIDGLLVNFWRAVKHDPEAVAEYASWPVTELDLLARHDWLIGKRESITAMLRDDPDAYDAKAAGWWCWGANTWIGSGFGFQAADQIPHLGDAGRGVNRRLPHLGDAGRGVNRRLPHLGDAGTGVTDWMYGLAERLRHVRIISGEWQRTCTPSVTTKHGITGVVLDPPYDAEGHDRSMYVAYGSVAKEVGAWCRENGGNPLFRIALCGYEGEHDLPGWTCEPWKARKGYGSDANTRRERIWFSPHCLSASLFDMGGY
ncbi:MAG: DNA adenine methylase [Fimbriimonadaceae bacterium]